MSLLAQVKNEYTLGYNYVNRKRIQYRDRIRKWNNQSKKKINITLIANHIDTLISSSYTDLLTVKFVSRDGFFGIERANALTYTARFDQQEQRYDQLYYQKEQDRYFFGVSIRLQIGWDDKSKTPLFVTVNPLSWIPDPLPSQTGRYGAQEYRFHGFIMRSSFFELKNSKLYSKTALDNLARNHFNAQEKLNRQARSYASNYQEQSADSVTENFAVEVYHHYTIYNGKKWLVTTDSSQSILLRKLELNTVLKEEKDSMDCPRPVVLNYWKPKRDDPFGESVCDYLEDKQDAMNIFANLSVAKAKKEALGGRFIINSRLIKNKEDILNPSVDTQYFWLDENELAPGENIGNAMVELPESQIKGDVFQMYNFLDNEGMKATGIDALQRGVVPDKSMTKAEAQQIQSNANLLSIRNAKVDSRGDKEFWFLRWRAYQEYFSKSDKKTIILDNDFERDVEVFKKDTYEYTEMPHIEIGSKADLDALDEKRKQFLSLYLPQVKQDPTKKQLTKDMLEREFLRLQGYKCNQINVMIPLSPDERIMLNDYVPMINSDIIPEGMFSRIKDIFTAYVYTQKCNNTKAKEVLLETLSSIMTGQDLQGEMQSLEAGGAMGNSAANIQMSQASQSVQGEDLVTRETVSQ